jgi:hypothetical protein
MCQKADCAMIDIDKKTGILRVHQSFVKKIEPATELEELKRVFPIWEQTVWDDERSSLKVELQNRQRDEIVHLLLYFVKSKLSSIEIFITGASFGDRWSRWSKAKEIRRKKYHESLFSSVLGKHRWGSVKSVLDKKAGYSCVRLEYADLST